MGYEIEWKRVKDELPPLNEEVLLLQKDGEISIGDRSNCYKFDMGDYYVPLYQVYAWTYLPESCDIGEDYKTEIFTEEQFLGCMCDVLIELDDISSYLYDLGDCRNKTLDRVFAKLYHDNIVADFYITFTFVTKYVDMDRDMYNDIFERNRINEKTYKEKYRDYLLKDIDPKIEEKIKFYLKEYFIDRKELSE